MSQARLPMHHAREILRLSREKGMTGRAIAQSLSLSPTTVTKYLKQLEHVPWPLPEPGGEALLAQILEKKAPKPSSRIEPDWEQVHRELQSHPLEGTLSRGNDFFVFGQENNAPSPYLERFLALLLIVCSAPS